MQVKTLLKVQHSKLFHLLLNLILKALALNFSSDTECLQTGHQKPLYGIKKMTELCCDRKYQIMVQVNYAVHYNDNYF